VLTGNGRVELLRTRWHEAGAGGGSPVDALLDLAESAVSAGVRQLACREGIDVRGFDRAARNLLKTAQLSISPESLRRIVESEGKAVLAAQQTQQLELDFCASDCKTLTPDGREVSRIYASADGVKVPVTTRAEKLKRRQTVVENRRQNPPEAGTARPRLAAVRGGSDQRYKQFNLTRFYSQDKQHTLVSVTRGDHRASQKLLLRDAARLRIRAADERVGLVDGAPCLKVQMDKLPLSKVGDPPVHAVGLDFYHLGEHVHEARRLTFGPDSPEGEAWAGQVLHAARHEGYQPFWDQLLDWHGGQRGKVKRRAAGDLLHYVAERKDMINYALFESRGFDVGTGPMEAACKSTTLRVKGVGMRWDSDNAEAMMALEAMEESNQWEPYWAKAARGLN
jgi:predicted peroxiredoxin